jgi:hypothetical protein
MPNNLNTCTLCNKDLGGEIVQSSTCKVGDYFTHGLPQDKVLYIYQITNTTRKKSVSTDAEDRLLQKNMFLDDSKREEQKIRIIPIPTHSKRPNFPYRW